MDNKTKKLIEQTVKQIIEKSENKINVFFNNHNKKIHFIPTRYRVFGGLLQSMNIKFGNFIELLIQNLINNDNRYEILNKYSGKKYNKFYISKENDNLIDNYITKCQTGDIKNLDDEFIKLRQDILYNSKNNNDLL